MSLLDKVITAVDRAKAKTSDLFIDLVFTVSDRSTYNPATGAVVKEPVNRLVSVMVDKWEYGEVNGESIRADDLKLFSFDVDTNIDEGDPVLFEGSNYAVVRTVPIMAGAQMVARYIQVRK